MSETQSILSAEQETIHNIATACHAYLLNEEGAGYQETIQKVIGLISPAQRLIPLTWHKSLSGNWYASDPNSGCHYTIEIKDGRHYSNFIKPWEPSVLISSYELLEDAQRNCETHRNLRLSDLLVGAGLGTTPIKTMKLPTNVEVNQWLRDQKYQTEQGPQEYTMYFDADMHKIITDALKQFGW